MEKDAAIHARYVTPARAYALIGDSDHAFKWLARALDARRRELSNLKTDPGFAAPRSDPRFGAMLDKVHLPHEG